MMRLLSGFMLVFGACTSASQSAVEAPVTGTIRLELPPGFVGTLDDRKEPIEPGVDHAVLAGEHTVVVQTPCGEHRAKVSVTAGGESVLGRHKGPATTRPGQRRHRGELRGEVGGGGVLSLGGKALAGRRGVEVRGSEPR